MQAVDVIGVEAVCKLIKSSKLSKFVISKAGSVRGYTPIYKCTEYSKSADAQQAFRDWANSILSMNPSNNLPYEIYLYDAKESDENIESDFNEAGNKRGTVQKDRIKFSFSLNMYNNNSSGGIGSGDIARIINETMDKREQDNELKRLRDENERLRRGEHLSGDDEEEEEENGIDAISKVSDMVKHINENIKLNKNKGAKISGDDDDDDLEIDDDDEVIEEEPPQKKKVSSNVKKMERINKALRILAKHDTQIDTDLLKLASLAEKNNVIFNNILTSLRNMKF
jgi:hypothetical protein